MAPWVFAAPAVAFALLPSVVGADHATDGIALTAGDHAPCVALAGVLIQPLARRLEAGREHNRAATTGLLVLAAGLVLERCRGSRAGRPGCWCPCAIVLGSAYGLLPGGRSARGPAPCATPRALAGLTAAYYALTYLGFAAPYLLALAADLTSHSTLLTHRRGPRTRYRCADHPGRSGRQRDVRRPDRPSRLDHR